jgi:hypothetical protein
LLLRGTLLDACDVLSNYLEKLPVVQVLKNLATFYGTGRFITLFTLREEHRLRALENRVLRIIFGPKKDKVTGGRRKLHNEELHNLYSSPSIIRMIK